MTPPDPAPTAVVTGASSGIGAAVVRALAAEGYRVHALARRADRLERVAATTDGEVHPLPCDLRDLRAIEDAFDRVGHTDVLVNSAGVGGAAAMLDGEVEDWRAMLDVNVLALARCTQLAVAQMRAGSDTGQVVHISSMSGHRVVAGSAMYAASKFAVQALTEGLRQELRAAGSRIRVASIAPGVVDTRFGLDPGEPGRDRPWPMLQPEDIARSVLHVIQAPPHVQIGDLLLRPTEQPS